MKYFKLDLLTLLISLFILSSCKKDGIIGLDIASQDSIKSVFTDTATVNAVTVKEDDVVTSNITQNAFGYIIDPIFGVTEANLALGLSLPSDSYSFGTTPTLDSAVLVLKYGNEFFGDSLTSSYNINVHQLNSNKAYTLGETYYNTFNWGDYSTSTVISNPLTVSKFAWNDSVSIVSIVKAAPDKVIKVAPQIRIKLDKAFMETHLLGADPAKLKNNTTFANYFKGIYVTVDKSQLPAKGGLIFFDLQSTVSALEVYYKTTDGTKTDTNLVTFKVSGASQINHDRVGTRVQKQINVQSDSVYVQPLAGVRTKLNFPYLKKFKEKLGEISINKAELVIPVLSDGTTDFLKPAPRLTLYTLDIAGQRKPVPDNAIGLDNRFLDERIFGGFYNATDKTYTINITSYIQDLINKPIVQYDTFIAPIDLPLTQRSNIFPSAVTAARSILGGTNHPQSPIKLKITYTKPN